MLICFQKSTRTVIELGRDMMTMEGVVAFKIQCISHYLFVSATILILDYCFSRDEPRAKERKDEILDCLNILENSRGESCSAIRGCQHLRNILQEASNSSQPQSTTLYPRAAELIKIAGKFNNSHLIGEGIPQNRASITQLPHLLDPSWGPRSADVLLDNQWQNLEFPTFKDANFDVQLDTSLSEEFLHDFDSTSGIFQILQMVTQNSTANVYILLDNLINPQPPISAACLGTNTSCHVVKAFVRRLAQQP